MKRRNVLQAITGTVVGGTALSGAAAAAREPTEVESAHAQLRTEYGTVRAVQASFEAQAGDLIRSLAREDLLDVADVTRFRAFREDEPLDERGGVRVMSTVDHRTEIPTAVLRVSERFDRGETTVFVMPEAGRSYATIEYDDGTKTLRVGTNEEVSPDCYHTHGDWEYVGTDISCDYDDACDGESACEGGCALTYYNQKTYEVYECGNLYYCSSETYECTTTRRELIDTTCTQECCSHSGPLCGMCGC